MIGSEDVGRPAVLPPVPLHQVHHRLHLWPMLKFLNILAEKELAVWILFKV
jgi:hypothetical protein